MKKQTEEELELETTTSGGMGSYPNNAYGWATKNDPKMDFPYEKQLDLKDDPKYANKKSLDLNEDDETEADPQVFEPVEFNLLSRSAKKFLLAADSTSTRNILQAAAALQVPLHNLVSTFYTNSLSVLRIAEEVMSCGSFVKIINTGPEWWFLLCTYKGIDFVLFNAVFGNPLPDPKDAYQLSITIKYSDFEMMPLAFPGLEFVLADK